MSLFAPDDVAADFTIYRTVLVLPNAVHLVGLVASNAATNFRQDNPATPDLPSAWRLARQVVEETSVLEVYSPLVP